jgi:hypothetical protein
MKTIEEIKKYFDSRPFSDIRACNDAVYMIVIPENHVSRVIINDLYDDGETNFLMRLVEIQAYLLTYIFKRGDEMSFILSQNLGQFLV